jgi:hypothetical protein
MDSSTSEVSPPIYPVADGPASWTTSQGDYGDGGLGALEDDELQDSDDPDTTDNFDQEQYEIQDQEHVGLCLLQTSKYQNGRQLSLIIIASPSFYLG